MASLSPRGLQIGQEQGDEPSKEATGKQGRGEQAAGPLWSAGFRLHPRRWEQTPGPQRGCGSASLVAMETRSDPPPPGSLGEAGRDRAPRRSQGLTKES